MQSTLNIHCRLENLPNVIAIAAGQSVLGNAVNLGEEHLAHITLVLSDFAGDATTAAANVCKLLQPVAKDFKSVTVKMQGGKLSPVGSYVFWDAKKSMELDALLEAVLVAIAPALARERPPPPWVATVCSPAEQVKRKEYLKQYGTVNAFEFFRPHVTVGFRSSTATSAGCSGGSGEREQEREGEQEKTSHEQEPFLIPHGIEFAMSRIHVNAVGDNGTVLAGCDLGEIALSGADIKHSIG